MLSLFNNNNMSVVDIQTKVVEALNAAVSRRAQ